MTNFSLANYLGIDLEYIVWGLAGITIVLFFLLIINIISVGKWKKKYRKFMGDADAKSLEEHILNKLSDLDKVIENSIVTKEKVDRLESMMNVTFQKIGLVKYDAFDEMGGKLSFSLALLNERNDGFIINAMHSREGCYTYIKEIIAGKSVLILAKEEQDALEMALKYR